MEEGTTGKRYPVSFTGSGWQFFKIWIVNILLTILTLYIYSAWAKVRTKRYFHGNTLLDGSSFEYHAKPLQILLGRLIAVFLFVAVTVGSTFFPIVAIVAAALLILIAPWAIWRSTKFNMRMTSYRNVRFGFDASVWPLYLYQLVLPLVGYVVLFVVPAIFYLALGLQNNWLFMVVLVVAALLLNIYITVSTHKNLSSYFLNGYRYGKSRFTGTLSLRTFFKTYIQAVLVCVGVLIAVSIVSFIVIYLIALLGGQEAGGLADWVEDLFKSLESAEKGEGSTKGDISVVLFAIAFYGFMFAVGYCFVAILRSRIRNHVFANAVLDQRVKFESDVSARGLWWIMVSNVLLIVFTLGLALPFTQIRMARFLASRSAAYSAVPLDQFAGEKQQEVGAFGDELGDAFDMDMDVGF